MYGVFYGFEYIVVAVVPISFGEGALIFGKF